MAKKYDPAIGAEIIHRFGAKPELLVQILHGFLERYGFISDEAVTDIAGALNLSRADVNGVVSFYHDFRRTPPGEHVLKICQAESCQAMGARELGDHAAGRLGVALNETTADGRITLEPVYCLGNCACSPAVMLDGKVFGRVDAGRLDALIGECGGK